MVIDAVNPIDLGRYSLIVHDGKVISASVQGLLYITMQTQLPDSHLEIETYDVPLNKAQQLTITALFANGIETFRNAPDINLSCTNYRVDIDPEFGYFKNLAQDCLCYQTHCGFRYEVIEFEPLSP